MEQHVKDWCYAECERQHAVTPRDISGMWTAWLYAKAVSERVDSTIDESVIRVLGMYVDDAANPGGRFRTGPAVFMNGGTALPANRIEDMLARLLYAWEANGGMTPDIFYQELMYIHPFKDGNGRVGALVYNILNGTIDNPVTPPEYR